MRLIIATLTVFILFFHTIAQQLLLPLLYVDHHRRSRRRRYHQRTYIHWPIGPVATETGGTRSRRKLDADCRLLSAESRDPSSDHTAARKQEQQQRCPANASHVVNQCGSRRSTTRKGYTGLARNMSTKQDGSDRSKQSRNCGYGQQQQQQQQRRQREQAKKDRPMIENARRPKSIPILPDARKIVKTATINRSQRNSSNRDSREFPASECERIEALGRDRSSSNSDSREVPPSECERVEALGRDRSDGGHSPRHRKEQRMNGSKTFR